MELTKGLVLLVVLVVISLSAFECQGQTQTPKTTMAPTPAPTTPKVVKEEGIIVTTHSSYADDFAQLRHFPWVPYYDNLTGSVPGIGFSNKYIHFLSVGVDFNQSHVVLYDYHLRAIAVCFNYHAGLRAAELQFQFMYVGVSRGIVQVAMDYITHTVYFVDPTYRHVIAAPTQRDKIPLDYYKTLVETQLEAPDGISLDVLEQRMFVSDRGSNPQIKSFTMTGGDPKIIVNTGLYSPRCLETDIFGKRLYWIDYIHETISSVKYDGTYRIRVKIIPHSSLFDMGIFRDVLIVTDSLNDYMYTMNKTTGEKLYKTLRLGNETMYGIAMYNIETQPFPAVADPCAALACEQLCLLNGTGAQCVCSEGYAMDANGTCVQAPNFQAVVFATATQICMVDLRTLAHQAYSENCVFTVMPPPPTTKAPTTTMAPTPTPPTPAPPSTASPPNGTQSPNGTSSPPATTRAPTTQAPTTTPKPTTPAPTAAPGDLIRMLDVDVAKRRFFFADASNRIFQRPVDLPIENRYKELIVSADGEIRGLAFDWLTEENLYYCESDTGKIYVVNVDVKATRLVSNHHDTGIHDLVMLPHDRKLAYMVNNSEIHTIDITGNNHMVLKTGLTSAKYLVYEPHQKSLYWMLPSSNLIYTMKFDGVAHQALKYTQRNSAHLGIFQDYLTYVYYSGDNSYFATYSLSRGTRVSLGYVTSFVEINTIKYLARQAQPTEADPCRYQNGLCEQICLTNMVNGKLEKMCVCSLGYTLTEDKLGCESDLADNNFIMFTDTTKNAIYQAHMQTNTIQAFETDEQGTYTAIMYQPYEEMFYYGDYDTGTLYRTDVNGDNREEVYYFGYSSLTSMALNEQNKDIYFTANDWSYIGMVTPYGESVDLIDTFLETLADIAIHPKTGKMYYAVPESEYGYGVIMQANMDGTGVKELIFGDDVQYPWGVAIDYTSDRLYWSDQVTNVIYRCFLNGTGCNTFYTDPGANITDIEINGDYLYYVALNNHHVTRLSIPNAGRTTYGSNAELGHLTHLTVYVKGNEGRQQGSEPCKDNDGKGNCSTICLPTGPNTRKCACDYGTNLKADSRTCEDIYQCEETIYKDILEITFNRNCTRYLGAECMYICPLGSAPSNNNLILKCQADGWDRRYETLCNETLCPNTIPNGNWSSDCKRNVGEVCSYGCGNKFNPAFDSVVCTNTGDWNENVATLCTDHQCTVKIPNGALALDCQRAPGTPACDYTCNMGYKKNPNVNKLTCMSSNQQWNQDLDNLCQALTCPSTPPNGVSKKCLDRSPGTKCDYSCYSGFKKPDGVSMMTCLINEMWDAHGKAPCIAVCNKRQFTCDDDSCIDAAKKCDGTPDCPDRSDENKITCPLMCPAAYQNGVFNNCVRLVGQPCMITCNEGFTNGRGIDTAVCSSKLIWTPERICEPITCPNMAQLGSLDPTCDKGFNKLCPYSCPSGFARNVTVVSIKCLGTGEWNQTSKLCFPISVSTPEEQKGTNVGTAVGITIGVIVLIIIILVLVGYIVFRRRQSYKETPYSMSFSNSNSNVAIENPGYMGSTTPSSERRGESDYDNINSSQMQPTKFVEADVPADHGMVNPMFMEKQNEQLPEVGTIDVSHSSISYKDWQDKQKNGKPID